jgi:hypothetical protein
LASQIRSSLISRSEIADGFVFRVTTSSRISSSEIKEWIGMERMCCPFLSIELVVGGDNEMSLIMRGGIEEMILAEFPLAADSTLHQGGALLP